MVYLRGAVLEGITHGGGRNDNKILSYADGDHETGLDDRLFVSGGIITRGGDEILWFSRMQRVTALFTTEIEYVARAEVVKKEILFLQQVQQFMKPNTEEYYKVLEPEDNDGAIKMTNNPTSWHRTKHMDVKHHSMRQMVHRRKINVAHIGTEEQRADLMTKALGSTRFKRHVEALINAV